MQKKQTYAELLKDPRWQKKRLEIMQRDNFMCQHCGATDNELLVHHRVYRKDAKPWEYENDELITLCKRCHENETEANKELYNTLNALKKQFIDCGLSVWLLRAVLSDISNAIENIYYGEIDDDFQYERDVLEPTVARSCCGWQRIKDAEILEDDFGIDMSVFFKVVYPNYKRNNGGNKNG